MCYTVPMLTISLTRHPHARKELFWDRTLRVVSRSGLNPTEAALLALLPTLPPANQPLFLGGRTGALALAARLRGWGGGGLTVHTFDAHTEGILRRNLAANDATVAESAAPDVFAVSTTLDVAALDCDVAFWQMTKGDGTAERRATARPSATSSCWSNWCATWGPRGAGLSSPPTPSTPPSWSASAKPATASPSAASRATFEVSLKGHAPIALTTWPGCFCHRRADMGGLALAEVVAEQVAFDPGDRVMDLGCGCGMVGILLATAFPEKGLRVDYQDSDASARDSVEDNLRRHPHAARVLFSAEGQGEAGAYDLLLANPPYFGDWRIAEFFIQTAARLLKAGGLIAFVTKRPAKPQELLEANGFALLNTFPRRGYAVLLAARR